MATSANNCRLQTQRDPEKKSAGFLHCERCYKRPRIRGFS